MPEGDSYARAARRVGAVLSGATIEGVGGSAPAIRRWSARILDARVTAVRARGKRLLIELDTGVTISGHLGMNGRVYVAAGQRRPGPESLLLQTATHHVKFTASKIEADRTAVIEAGLERLGPDLLDPSFQTDLTRASLFPKDRTVSELLLDQRVMAGVGNIIKNETLFLERINPATPVGHLTQGQVDALIGRARRLLEMNAARSSRSTTGQPGPNARNWVYDRAGLPCRRCGQAILKEMIGNHHETWPARVTFWCPGCQPESPLIPDPDT
jgi:endonuclease VIII